MSSLEPVEEKIDRENQRKSRARIDQSWGWRATSSTCQCSNVHQHIFTKQFQVKYTHWDESVSRMLSLMSLPFICVFICVDRMKFAVHSSFCVWVPKCSVWKTIGTIIRKVTWQSHIRAETPPVRAKSYFHTLVYKTHTLPSVATSIPSRFLQINMQMKGCDVLCGICCMAWHKCMCFTTNRQVSAHRWHW